MTSSAIQTARSAVLAAALAAHGACAAPLGYDQASVWNDHHGWRDADLGSDEFAVVYRGDERCEMGRARGYALLRAAELTRERGALAFRVLDQEQVERTQQVPRTTPGAVGGTVMPLPSGKRLTREPVVVLLIRVLRGDHASDPADHEAQELIARLRAELGLDPG